MLIYPLLLSLLLLPALSQLLYVSSLFRHGARYTVLQLYDHTDSALDDGQLTGVGMRQHYNLGRYLREQYIDSLKFLNKTFDHREIGIFSTQKNRTIESAISQLYGLYPDGFGPILPKEIENSFLLPPYENAQHFINVSQSYSLPNGGSAFPIHSAQPFFNCPHQTALILQTMKHKTTTVAKLDLQYTPLFIRMANIFKLKPSYEANIGVMVLLYDNLIADYYKGKQFSNGFDHQDLMNLRHLSQIMMSLCYEGQAGSAISTLLFKKLILDFDHKIKNNSISRKWTLLSGHDTNVLPTMLFLNISSSDCLQDKWKGYNLNKYLNCEDGPDFAASLLFELHKDGGEYNVKVKYNGRYVNLCGKKEINCGYQQWKQRVERQYVDEGKLCGLSKKENINNILREEVE